jgi:cyclopropane fatty-acyl-phospholipid synthase-like methyltransferase
MKPNEKKMSKVLNKLVSCIRERRLPWQVSHALERIYIGTLNLIGADGLRVQYYHNEREAVAFEQEYGVKSLMADVILSEFRPSSIIDIGCGIADILSVAEKRGIEVLGLDASRAYQKHSKISPNKFILCDLRKKYVAARKFDLCLCLEVAEHIDRKYSDTLLDTVTSASSTIVFTAAPVGQGGMGDHVNEQPYEWWIDKMKFRRYELDIDYTDRMKRSLSAIPDLPKHYAKNLMIFRNKNSERNETKEA